jgi:hypothetical protein
MIYIITDTKGTIKFIVNDKELCKNALKLAYNLTKEVWNFETFYPNQIDLNTLK